MLIPKYAPLFILLAFLLGSCAGPVSQEPKNLSTVKSEVKEYVTTKQYDARGLPNRAG